MKKKNETNNKYKLVLIPLLFALTGSISQAQDELTISLNGNDVVRVANRRPVVTKAINFTAKYIAELQETISFNTNLTKNIGLRLSNSRFIFPKGNGDFIVTDETRLSANFATNAFQKTLNDLNIQIAVNGAATPSVKRFFISSAVDKKDRETYEPSVGPQNTPVAFGIDDQLYDLGHDILVDKTRYARYNDWSHRFTRNITGLPTSAQKADDMVIGEGYSFAFEGQLALGPSAYFNLAGSVPLGVNFSFQKIIKSGKFEIIIVKSATDKLLFSIRQARVVGNDNFRLSYGAHVGADLGVIVGSDSLFSSVNLKLISIQQTNEWKTEERFNSVYEIDLSNPANRNLYDHAISTFDFSLFEVFTFQDISQSSNVLRKFRNANLNLVLEQNEKARLVSEGLSTNILRIDKRNITNSSETAHGTARFDGRQVETSRGSLQTSRSRSNVFQGKELETFEFKAYEEYGEQASSGSDDVIMLARYVLFDSETKNRKKARRLRRGSIQKYVADFNQFTPSNNPIIFDSSSEGRQLETTQGLMEFYITRADIASLGRLDPVVMRRRMLTSFQVENIEALASVNPKQWSVQGERLTSMKNFCIGFEELQASLKNGNKRASADAITKMLSRSQHARFYAIVFKQMLVMAGRTPLINITFTNSKLELNYSNIQFEAGAFVREGLALSDRLNRTFIGQSYYDDIHITYLEEASLIGRHNISYNFKRKFAGYIKLVFKEKTGSGQVSRNLGEFIIDVREVNSRSFSFNLAGHSQAEVIANSIYRHLNNPQDLEIFTALSFDDRIYDELVQVK